MARMTEADMRRWNKARDQEAAERQAAERTRAAGEALLRHIGRDRHDKSLSRYEHLIRTVGAYLAGRCQVDSVIEWIDHLGPPPPGMYDDPAPGRGDTGDGTPPES